MKKAKYILNLVLTALVCLLLGGITGGSAWLIVAGVLFAGSIITSYALPTDNLALTICGNIAKSINPDCNNPLVGGLEVTVYLMNKGDVVGYTPDPTNALIVSAFTMAAEQLITYSGLTGTFAVGEIVKDATLAKVGVVLSDNGSTTMLVRNTASTFTGSDVLTGQTSGAVATVSSVTATTAKAYKYEGIKTSQEAKLTLAKGKYNSNFDHEISLVVFNVDPATKAELDKMRNGVLTAVVEYKFKGTNGNGAFEVFGLDQGLEVTKMERDSASKDTDGAYAITLKTVAGYSEPHLPRTFWDGTGYASTLAVLESYV